MVGAQTVICKQEGPTLDAAFVSFGAHTLHSPRRLD